MEPLPRHVIDYRSKGNLVSSIVTCVACLAAASFAWMDDRTDPSAKVPIAAMFVVVGFCMGILSVYCWNVRLVLEGTTLTVYGWLGKVRMRCRAGDVGKVTYEATAFGPPGSQKAIVATPYGPFTMYHFCRGFLDISDLLALHARPEAWVAPPPINAPVKCRIAPREINLRRAIEAVEVGLVASLIFIVAYIATREGTLWRDFALTGGLAYVLGGAWWGYLKYREAGILVSIDHERISLLDRGGRTVNEYRSNDIRSISSTYTFNHVVEYLYEVRLRDRCYRLPAVEENAEGIALLKRLFYAHYARRATSTTASSASRLPFQPVRIDTDDRSEPQADG